MIIIKYKEKVPTWALSYLVNGDYSGITDEDKELVDEFWNKYQNQADIFNCIITLNFPDDIDSDKYFCPFPAFGLACDVVDCTVVFVD